MLVPAYLTSTKIGKLLAVSQSIMIKKIIEWKIAYCVLVIGTELTSQHATPTKSHNWWTGLKSEIHNKGWPHWPFVSLNLGCSRAEQCLELKWPVQTQTTSSLLEFQIAFYKCLMLNVVFLPPLRSHSHSHCLTMYVLLCTYIVYAMPIVSLKSPKCKCKIT